MSKKPTDRSFAETISVSTAASLPPTAYVCCPPPPRKAAIFRSRVLALTRNRRSREIFSYLFWGAATTLVNFVVYGIATRLAGVPVVPATAVAWIVSVLFAFVTNKFWVFSSRSVALPTVLRELASFIAARLASGGIELFMMWFFVDVLRLSDWAIKVAAQIVVIVSNYVFSAVFVFKREKGETR